MDFVPEIVDGAIILNAIDVCSVGNDCRSCTELAVGIHNWLISHEIKYLVVDFQDDKEVCTTVLTELLQLKKRLQYPFLFCGMMENPRKFLESFNYSDYPVFDIPEEAAAYLKAVTPNLLMVDLADVKVGEPIPCTRSRTYKAEEGETETETEETEVEAEA